MKYRSEIDGLRAVAVIPVILFHAGFSAFSGGYVGVDVFFVISGYLITTIILSEIEKGDFSLVNFYERRARRILPALFFVMAASLIPAWLWLQPTDLEDFSESLVAVSLFSSNILFWMESNYWDAAVELKPLIHTWSLAVEEQYYLLFPLLLMLLWRFRPRWVLGSFMVIILLSLALAEWGASRYPAVTFYLLPTRAWELAIGASIALYFLRAKSPLENRSVKEVSSIAGLGMIAYSVIMFDDHTPFPSLHALLPTVGTGLIILFASPQTSVGRLLSTRLLVTIGLVSYSTYLWHQPMFAFARHKLYEAPSDALLIGLSVASVVLGYLSWRFVEKPFRKRGYLSRKTIFIFAFTGSIASILIGLLGQLDNGHQSRDMYQALSIKRYEPDNRILQTRSWQHLQRLADKNEYAVVLDPFEKSLWFDLEDPRKRVLIIGNSHSKDVYNLLYASRWAKKHTQIARYGVQIADLADASADLFTTPNYLEAEIVVIASRYFPGDVAVIKSLIDRIVKGGKQAVIIKGIYEFPFFNGKTTADRAMQKLLRDDLIDDDASAAAAVDLINATYFEEWRSGETFRDSASLNVAIDGLKKVYPDLIVLDRMDYICDRPRERCFGIGPDLEKYFYDYGHHTLAGSTFFGEQIDKIGWLDELVR